MSLPSGSRKMALRTPLAYVPRSAGSKPRSAICGDACVETADEEGVHGVPGILVPRVDVQSCAEPAHDTGPGIGNPTPLRSNSSMCPEQDV
jgi:hypothetical protein